MKGEKIDDLGVLSYLREHVLLRHTSMSIEQIRELDVYDFDIHSQLAMIFQAGEQGAFADDKQKKRAPTASEVIHGKGGIRKGSGLNRITQNQRFDPNLGDFVDV